MLLKAAKTNDFNIFYPKTRWWFQLFCNFRSDPWGRFSPVFGIFVNMAWCHQLENYVAPIFYKNAMSWECKRTLPLPPPSASFLVLLTTMIWGLFPWVKTWHWGVLPSDSHDRKLLAPRFFLKRIPRPEHLHFEASCLFPIWRQCHSFV